MTGSRYLLSYGGLHLLVDCGLFQGYKNLRLKNWERFPIAPERLDAVLLTHAHLDHSGYIPLLVKNGFRGPVYCTSATRDLCGLLLPDSGYLQEEEAEFANRRGYSKHKPALPLYTEKEARRSLECLQSVEWQKSYSIVKGEDRIDFEFHPAGHLLGAATICVHYAKKTLAFSGDLGRESDPITRNPSYSLGCDTLIVESTYGDRHHDPTSPLETLKGLIRQTIGRGGTLLVPTFAVGRAQLVLHYIHELQKAHQIPVVPVYLNSPMAIRANDVMSKHSDETKMSPEELRAICKTAKSVATVEESIALNENKDAKIILAASGMATGGRILHHLKAFAPDPKNTILFVGFQAGGTRGDAILKGAKEIKIHGELWPVRAQIAEIDTMSAHADGNEIIAWIGQLKKKPSRIFVTHGEPNAADFLRRRIEQELRIGARVPDQAETFDLDEEAPPA